MWCPQCNSKLKKNSKFCPECGFAILQDDLPVRDERKSDPVKIVLALITLLAISVVVVLLLRDGEDQPSGVLESNIEAITETTSNRIAFSDDPGAISAASQSVVKLNCYDRIGELSAIGSGFACYADNVIVTNYHVIEGDVYSIEACSESGTNFEIKYVLTADKDRDIAILATSRPHNLRILQTGDSSNLQKGEKVVAIGSPLGLLNSVSDGVFSGYIEDGNMDVLQFTASISNGSSGGALFNDRGEVLGITFASYEDGQNLNLAVPISDVTSCWENRKESEKISITQLYEEQPHIYTVDYVIENADKLSGWEITIDGYVSYTFGFTINGEQTKSVGVVTNPKDVFGSMFTDQEWDYADAGTVNLDEAITGITVEVSFEKHQDMASYLELYRPGTYVTCTGIFKKITMPDGQIVYNLYSE